MAEGVPARLTAAEGRKFGLSVGGAFLILGMLMHWRGHARRGLVLDGVAALFVLGGVLLPTYMGPVQRAWMGLAHAISKVTTPIFMGIVYYAVITPIGFTRRAFGSNPLSHARTGGSAWVAHEPATPDPKSMERQF
jgi:hypothetical protein